jgi:molybdate transport system regulatory protein
MAPQTPVRLADALGHEVADKRLDILRRIGEAGSISEAARGAGVSYKAAWQAVDTLSNLAGTALLERSVGGSGGGGAQLTAAGHQLLAGAAQLQAAREQVLARLASGAGTDAALPGLAALGLRTSMRNQLPCTVRRLTSQGGAMRVELTLPDGTPLASRITRESAQLLALAPGLPVLALCKATAVTVVTGTPARDGRNCLGGHARRVSRAAGGGEVALALGCGLQMVGFWVPAGGEARLKAGAACVALVDEAAVVIALAT